MKGHVMKRWIVFLLAAALPGGALADTYTVDKDHTYPSFEFPHMGISVWRGKFNRSAGKVTLDRVARTGTVQILTYTDSVDFGHKAMNEAAMAEEWLNVSQNPTMSYSGTLRFEGDKPVAVDGQLTLRGVTKPLALKINRFNCITHPLFRREVCGADAEGDLDRADYGMSQFTADGMGKLHLRIQVEALKD